MSKELFETITREELNEMDVIYNEVIVPVTFDELKQIERAENFKLNERLSEEETDRQKMPFDFWNHGFNGHSGFKPDYYYSE